MYHIFIISFFLDCVLHRSTRPHSIMHLYGANNCTIVSPSMMTSAGTPCSAISPPQSSMADMAIRETVPHCPRLSTKSQCRPGRKAGAVRLLHTQENPIGSILVWKKSFSLQRFSEARETALARRIQIFKIIALRIGIVHVGAARASKGLFSTVENSPFGIRCAMRGRSQRSWTQSEKYIPLTEHSPLCRVLNVP